MAFEAVGTTLEQHAKNSILRCNGEQLLVEYGHTKQFAACPLDTCFVAFITAVYVLCFMAEVFDGVISTNVIPITVVEIVCHCCYAFCIVGFCAVRAMIASNI